jgi:transcriptional regulator with XRE-family HTH domain
MVFSPTELKRLRKERHLTQEALAKLAGLHYLTVGVWERGGTRNSGNQPRWETIVSLARALNVEPEALLDEQPPAAAGQTAGNRLRGTYRTAKQRGDS